VTVYAEIQPPDYRRFQDHMSDDDSKVINSYVDMRTGIRELRQKFLTNLNQMQRVQLTRLEHEAERLRKLSISYNEPDPRVKMLEANIEGTKQAIKVINNQLEINRIIVPKVKEGEALVHGRITDENGYGVRNLVVSLVAEGERLKVMGKSDASGYYAIILPAAIVNKIKRQKEQNAITVYVHYLNVLVYKSAEPIKLADQENKYEVIIDKNELNAINQQEKEKKEASRTKNR
jgi:hypothetical protein